MARLWAVVPFAFFNLADELATRTENGQDTSYQYDAAGQLTAADNATVDDEAYTWDANGNRADSGFVVGSNNQILSDGTNTFAYDAEGNLIRRTDIATGDFTEYAYDHRNRLTAAVRSFAFSFFSSPDAAGSRASSTQRGILCARASQIGS